MKYYPAKTKSYILEQLLPPNSISVSYLAKTEGIPKSTLYEWRKKALDSMKIIKLEQTLQYKDDKRSEKKPHELLHMTITSVIKI
ncbi:hypothetical protein ABLB69_16470 [Xenorhabdus khoisanae]|uniref:hypothetical protein n=1 Tax=Xenorhabdus khoisanae TaxID=880157 RepID=UPI0032B7A90E